MPIGRGFLKFDDYAKFGRLFDAMEACGAYEIAYYPHKEAVYVWLPGRASTEAENWLKKHGYKYERRPGKNENFVVLVVEWGVDRP